MEIIPIPITLVCVFTRCLYFDSPWGLETYLPVGGGAILWLHPETQLTPQAEHSLDSLRSDEGLTLETSAWKLITEASLS